MFNFFKKTVSASASASSMSTYASILRARYPFRAPTTAVDHLVVGGGVIGLSVAAGLVNTTGKGRTTFVVERRGLVIHSGIYYPIGSLKSELCIRGRDLLYKRCEALGIRHRKTQKLIVATDRYQIPYLDGLSTHSQHESFITGRTDVAWENNSLIPCYFLSGDEARRFEPDLSPNVCAALLVTDTGIVDSAGLVDSLAREIEEPDYLETVGAGPVPPTPAASAVRVGVGLEHHEFDRGEGVIVPGTRVVRIDREEGGKGWIVQLETGWEGLPEGERGEVEAVRAEVVINAAGLNSASLVEQLLPEKERTGIWVSKGNYMKYKGPGVENVKHLIYPCPNRSLDSLGTHLTMDLDGNIRFGPDVEPLGDAAASAANPDYWQEHLAPSDAQLESIGRAAQQYLPGIDPTLLTPDYAGFRPNIQPPGSGFFDFVIRHSRDRRGLIDLLGFASPGLTSALATGERVARLVRRDIWKTGGSIDPDSEGWGM